jgi:hypothetical protein
MWKIFIAERINNKILGELYKTIFCLKKFSDFKSKEMRVRQRAVALYFIDKLALRAGNEKDDDQADTVGCCSLRVEHITLHKEREGFQSTIFIKLTIEII